MRDGNALLTVSLTYAAFLFLIAFWAERRAAHGRLGWLRSPWIYTLSLSVYCTGWTFYGAVGSAARGGLDYVPIYLGPSLVFFGWWFLIRKLVRISRTQRITSIADLISSRYGKSATLGVVVTLLAVIGSTPYIALQLQSLTLSVSVLSEGGAPPTVTLWLAIGLAIFAILFGTRTIDANEQHHGVVTAIAFESVVKLIALVAVGIFAVWGLRDGPAHVFEGMPAGFVPEQLYTPRWITLTFLSATAIICLPRMFQVLVVENADERHLTTASWAFPAYLLLISLFVLPIAVVGKQVLPQGANPDLYVLTLPLSQNSELLTLLAYLGGFSASTSMVIVSAIALSTMISNHIAVPVWLRLSAGRVETSGDVRSVVLTSRRISIGVILGLGYLYFLVTGGSGALASIGLISFAGVAQLLPSLLGGIYWRGATRKGALTGIGIGFAIWAYTLFLPSFEGAFILSATTLSEGPFGIAALRPQALFGLQIDDPLVHTIFWSILLNTTSFVAVSLMSQPPMLERIQGTQFVDVFRQSEPVRGMVVGRYASSEELFALAQRILGRDTAHALFAEAARMQGKSHGLPDPDDALIARVERELSGSIGSASAHAMVGQIAAGGQISVDQLIRMADETAQIVEYSQQLEQQSQQLEETASELRSANARLTTLSAQKDAFLSQVSHELRTPMTSIRSFAEILKDREIEEDEAQRFTAIIHDESQRLTRLLDEILDLSFLESGQVRWDLKPCRVQAVIDTALSATEGQRRAEKVALNIDGDGLQAEVMVDFDRLVQVLVNLISNAVKYGQAEAPRINIRATISDTRLHIDIADNGPGIPEDQHDHIFEKFARLSEASLSGSAGLGLPISREIVRNLGGKLTFLPQKQGAAFRVNLPLTDP
ncbi:ATP-binding protein [Halovulum sp. GXIMD14793]